MKQADSFEIFLMAAPGLEEALCAEVGSKGFKKPKIVPGGVITRGNWQDVWRANLWIRGAGCVLARIASFRAAHLAELDKGARRVAWSDFLRPDRPFRVEASCRKSRIYHSGAAAERIERAITATIGAEASDDAEILIKARLENDLCTISIDTSGAPLHKRGHKEAVNAAPMRETMASLFLFQCGYDGREPVLDPMCGSGTFVIEAAEIAARLNPGRSRSFAFEHLATFDPEPWHRLRSVKNQREPEARFYGSDRDAGAIAFSTANAKRAGVDAWTDFSCHPVSDCTPPTEEKGLVIMNPPYGARLGEKKALRPLYSAIGQTLRDRFAGWRVGLIATEPDLVRATGLPFLPPAAPILHGGLRVTLYRTEALRGI